MEDQKYKAFDELKNELLERLIEKGCTPVTVTGYKYVFNSIEKFLRQRGYHNYSKEAGQKLLDEYLLNKGRNDYYKNLHTVISRMNDIIECEWNIRHSDNGRKFRFSNEFQQLLEEYCSFQQGKGLRESTLINKRYAISWFLDELTAIQCEFPDQISPGKVSLACIGITDHSHWNEIRNFMSFLSENGYVKADYSTIVPHFSKPYILPSVYTEDEIRRIENAVDKNTDVGKRDYAMLLLASRMGMRSGDIVRLRLRDVASPENGINIIQQKTQQQLHLPFIPEVLEAVEEYLLVRPESESDFLFLHAHAPYQNVTTGVMRYAVRKYINLAGIDTKSKKQGPHVLRSSLASSMVNDSVSYETVRKILGHNSENAIKHYARIDVENLRHYSLDPPEAVGTFKAFLYQEVQNDE